MLFLIEIKLASMFGRQLSTRAAAEAIFEELKTDKPKALVLNFAEVESVSRSFADQLLKVRKQLMDLNWQVRFIRMEEPVAELFDKVELSYYKLRKLDVHTHKSQATSREELYEFLLSF